MVSFLWKLLFSLLEFLYFFIILATNSTPNESNPTSPKSTISPSSSSPTHQQVPSIATAVVALVSPHSSPPPINAISPQHQRQNSLTNTSITPNGSANESTPQRPQQQQPTPTTPQQQTPSDIMSNPGWFSCLLFYLKHLF